MFHFRLQNVLQYLILALLAFLPIQTLLALFAKNILHFEALAFWKELLVLIFIFSVGFQIRLQVLKYKFVLSSLILITFLSSISAFLNHLTLSQYLVGFRYELLWVWFFGFLYIWLQEKLSFEILKKYCKSALFFGFTLVMILSVINFVLGGNWLASSFNFANSTSDITPQSCSNPDKLSLTDYCSFAGTFGNPNHFAGYLILVLPLFIYFFLNTKSRKVLHFLPVFVAIVSIFLSNSRFAILGSIIALFLLFLSKRFKKITLKIWTLSCLGLILILNLAYNLTTEDQRYALPPQIAKASSTAGHAKSTLASLQILQLHPDKLFLGYGIVASGPASKIANLAKPQIVMENISVANKLLLPINRLAIPENWYLQVLLNNGLIYSIIYTNLVFALIFAREYSSQNWYLILGFLVILIGNFVLHLWENQTIALYFGITYLVTILIDKKSTKIEAES
jgi:O-Antigen ligase